MGLYDIDFNGKVSELSPPDKRGAKGLAWLRSLVAPIVYLWQKYLVDSKTGSSYPEWTAGTYAKGDKVVYKKLIYESLIDGNTDTPPSSNWSLYLNWFIGSDTRVRFNGQKLVLEYALNTYYNTTFRQPTLVSDIYIDTLPYQLNGFLVGQTIGSTVGQTTSSGFVNPPTPFLHTYNFQINIPTAVYALTNESEVRNFVDGLIPISLNYSIVTY